MGWRIAADLDWMGTVRQTLPSALRVLGSLQPTWQLPGIHSIDAAFLLAARLSALIWDVDGTLTHRHSCEVAPETRGALERLLGQDGLRHVILSNCGEARFTQLGEVFPTLPIVKGYVGTDGLLVFRVREHGGDRWTCVPRGVLRPIRKPDPALVRFALEVLGVDDGKMAAVVGDQYLTDIAAANRAGVRSIKVPTIGRESFPVSVRMLQSVDGWLYRFTTRVDGRRGWRSISSTP